MECCVMCGGGISLVERDLAYVEMFSGRRPKALHARCYEKLRRTTRGFCAQDVVNHHAATEYCPFCFWMFCAEHSPRDKHECNFEATTDWSATSIIEDAVKIVGVRAKQYNANDKRGERSMRQVVAIVNALRGESAVDPADASQLIPVVPLTVRDGWLFMVVLKLVRGSMPTPSRDTFVDLAGYAGLAGEERGEELKRK